MLANSWVRLNFGSIALYFLIYFRMDSDCLAGKVEAKKRRKKGKIGRNHQELIDRRLCPIDQMAEVSQLF